MMKRIISTLQQVLRTVVMLAVLLVLGAGAVMAQTVSNVSFRQDGQLVHITYDLSAKADITVELSTDGGRTYGGIRMVHVSGDVGKGVTAGNGKRITWTVLQDCDSLQGDRIIFRVMAQSADGTNKTFTVGGVSFTMVYVNGGTFLMGSQKSSSWASNYDVSANDNEGPLHSVTLSGYYIGETEVTQALWMEVMGSNPSYFKGEAELPVENVSWEDICGEDGKGTDPDCFLYKLNRLTGLTFRLPTEAEWEYAARGGSKSRGYRYCGSNSIDDVAWYWKNSGDRYLRGTDAKKDWDKIERNNSKTHTVKGKRANELGLYDMSGNVQEWCSDWKSSYVSDSQINPKGPSEGPNILLSKLDRYYEDFGRVCRGGCWSDYARDCRVSYRDDSTPTDRYSSIGFRLVLCP